MIKNVTFHSFIVGAFVMLGVLYTGNQFVSLVGGNSGTIYYGTQFMFHFGEESKLLELGGVGVYMVLCKYFVWLACLLTMAHSFSSVLTLSVSKKRKAK